MKKNYLQVIMVILLMVNASAVNGQVDHSKHGAYPSGSVAKSFQAEMSVPSEIRNQESGDTIPILSLK